MGEKKYYVQKMGTPKSEKQPIFFKNTKMGTFQKKGHDGRSPKNAHEKNRHLVKKKSFHGRTGHKKGCYEIFANVGVLNKNAQKIDTMKKKCHFFEMATPKKNQWADYLFFENFLAPIFLICLMVTCREFLKGFNQKVFFFKTYSGVLIQLLMEACNWI